MTSVIMGFDFGTTKIGISVGQEITKTATPVGTIIANNGIPLWTELDKVVFEWDPLSFVVGLPINMDGSVSQMSKRAEKFSRRISDRYEITSEMFDERLTTFEARDGQNGNDIDSFAAKLILESWFRK